MRRRLVDVLLGSDVGIVEAGAGYGKSVLARQYELELSISAALVPLDASDDDPEIFTASMGRALSAGKLSDLSAATGVDPSRGAAGRSGWIDQFLDALVHRETPLLLVLDDAHHLRRHDTAALVLRLARGVRSPHRLLVTARRLGPELEPLRSLPQVTYLDTRALEFTTAETSQLFRVHLERDPTQLETNVLLEATRGWATALVLAVNSHRTGGPPPPGLAVPATEGDVIAPLVRSVTEVLDPDELSAVVQLSHLPLLSPEVAQAASGCDGIFDRVVAAGLPLVRTSSGWWEMPGPVAAYLQLQEPLDPSVAVRVSRVYRADGAVLQALRVLLAAGTPTDAAALLAGMAHDEVEDLGLAVLRDFTEQLPEDATRAHPRTLLQLARVAETAHRADVRSGALERARTILTDAQGLTDAAVVLREVDAERARDLVWDERTRSEAEALARSVIESSSDEELTARARALDVLGRLASWFSAEGPKPEAEELLKESARLSARIGRGTWRAQALVALAMGFYFALCRFDRALSTIDDVLADLPARSRYRALVQSFRGDVLIELGRYGEVESSIDEMREIGRACGEEWALAYAAWTESALASYLGDGPRTVRAVTEADSHRDAWYDQASGVEFLACACDYLDRAGEHRMALEYLGRAKERMAGCERPVRVFGAGLLARSGDPDEAARTIDTLFREVGLEPQERWPLLLLRAYCAFRKGDPDAGGLAAEAFETCRRLGHPDGPFLRERAVAEALLPLAVEAGSEAAAALARESGKLSLTLLGGFEARRGGKVIQLPPGRPSKAVRAVATSGGRMHQEELQELLWPDTDVETGRNRLRNLLSRINVLAAGILSRDAEMVVLADDTECDAWLFESHARAALDASSQGEMARAAKFARVALALYRGQLLPDDRLEWWTTVPRERLKNRFVDLLDLLASDAERRDEVDEALRLLERAVEAEPHDEKRYVRLATLLLSQGRTGSARTVLRRARESLDELGIGASTALTMVERKLDV